MTFSKIGRIVTALVASAALGLGMTACGGGTIGYMWVLGNSNSNPQTGAISGFKIDDYTGNLTTILNSPFSSGGTNPQMLLVKPGGRFVYVINSGTGQVGTPGSSNYVAPSGSGISVFSVGGDGTLTFQETYYSQGTAPIYASFDSTGGFLYVLDKYSPNYGNPVASGSSTIDLNGDITAFSIAADTGRLTLVTNTTVLSGNKPTTYFEVGQNPIMAKVGSSGCLYTLSSNSIFPYVVSSATGQLTVATTGPIQILGTGGQFGATGQLNSINTSAGTSAGSYVFLTDAQNNEIYTLEATGTACSLSPVAGSQQTNPQVNAVPVNSLTSNNGKYLYVVNNLIQSSTGTAQSTISAFTITNGMLQTLSDGTSNPYSVGAGPVCIVEDPSSKYIYTSNNIDSTVTGKLLDQNRGYLAPLTHGSTFPAAMNPTCLAVSGSI
jgi:6-phosphogluconolactonase (cycloisomerase 2 family)